DLDPLTRIARAIRPLPASGARLSKQKGPRRRRPFRFLHRVLGGLDRAGPDDLAGWLGLEHHFLAREGVGALPSLGRGLLDHDELREAGDEEYPVLLELLVANVNERF